MMKPIPDLEGTARACEGSWVFGTKMRSVVMTAEESGVAAMVAQRFDVARQILAAGLVSIIEPEVSEVDIHSPEEAATEKLLKAALLTSTGWQRGRT